MKLQFIILVICFPGYFGVDARAGELPSPYSARRLPWSLRLQKTGETNSEGKFDALSSAIGEEGEKTRATKINQSVPEPMMSNYKYRGNSFSNKFHRPWCPFSRVMNAKHVVLFYFRYEAIAQGFAPCQYCLPSAWKSVHCRLLPSNKAACDKDVAKDPAQGLSSIPQI